MNEIFINVREREKLIDGLASAYRDVLVEYNSRFSTVWCLPGLEAEFMQYLLPSQGLLFRSLARTTYDIDVYMTAVMGNISRL
jgi:hypothetical protein